MLMRPKDRRTGSEMGRCRHPVTGRGHLPSGSSVGRRAGWRGFRTPEPASAESLPRGRVDAGAHAAEQDSRLALAKGSQLSGLWDPLAGRPLQSQAQGTLQAGSVFVSRFQHVTSHLVPNRVICHHVSLYHRVYFQWIDERKPGLCEAAACWELTKSWAHERVVKLAC